MMGYAPPRELARGAEAVLPEVLRVPDFLPRRRADALLADALALARWQRERIVLFGRARTAPRLTAWYGEPGTRYRYSGATREALPWPPWLADALAEVRARAAWRFDFALANRYRDGGDCLGWHADDEAALGGAPVIASLSVGAARMFRIRPRAGGASIGRPLGHGALLLMWGRSQRDYKHCVPRTRRPVGERVNFTFRCTRP